MTSATVRNFDILSWERRLIKPDMLRSDASLAQLFYTSTSPEIYKTTTPRSKRSTEIVQPEAPFTRFPYNRISKHSNSSEQDEQIASLRAPISWTHFSWPLP